MTRQLARDFVLGFLALAGLITFLFMLWSGSPSCMTTIEEQPHEHKWVGSGLVIDTYPPQDTYFCECGAATHDPSTGKECRIQHFGQPRPVRDPQP